MPRRRRVLVVRPAFPPGHHILLVRRIRRALSTLRAVLEAYPHLLTDLEPQLRACRSLSRRRS